MKKYKFGIIGCGSIAEIAHLPSIKKSQEAELEALCDINPDRVKETAVKWGAKWTFTDYREMFKKVKLDAVVIATPNNMHRNQAIAAAKAGVHVVVEKPLAITNKEAWDIVETCRKY